MVKNHSSCFFFAFLQMARGFSNGKWRYLIFILQWNGTPKRCSMVPKAEMNLKSNMLGMQYRFLLLYFICSAFSRVWIILDVLVHTCIQTYVQTTVINLITRLLFICTGLTCPLQTLPPNIFPFLDLYFTSWNVYLICFNACSLEPVSTSSL